MAFAEAAEAVTVTLPLIATAAWRVEKSGFSFWDSPIVETAIDSGAQRLFTEDLQDGQVIGQLRVLARHRAWLPRRALARATDGA